MCSDIRLPSAGELHIYSPGSTSDGTVCERDCMHYGAFDVPHSHKVTTPLLQGETYGTSHLDLSLECHRDHNPAISYRLG